MVCVVPGLFEALPRVNGAMSVPTANCGIGPHFGPDKETNEYAYVLSAFETDSVFGAQKRRVCGWGCRQG